MTCSYPPLRRIQLLIHNSTFATPQSYQDIYGHIRAGRQIFLKGKSYTAGPESEYGIVTIRDPARHRVVRKSLSHAFSAKALRIQTDIVLKYVDSWVDQIKKHGDGPEEINVNEVCEEPS